MKLYFIRCGFYDEEISDGIYEFHVNIPVIATNVEDAKKKVRTVSQFAAKKMHIDGIQEIESVEGYTITFTKNASADEAGITNIRHRDL
jgi:hypothetical protein